MDPEFWKKLGNDFLAHPIRWLVVAFLGLVFVGSLFGGSGSEPSATNDFADLDEPCTREVAYFVDGTAREASVTLQNASGNTEQANIDVPMTNKGGSEGLHLGDLPCGTFVYISAQNQNSYGNISCEITADGVTIEEARSSGAFVIATCSGSVQ